MTYEVIIEDYVLQCKVTYWSVTKPNPNSWSSPDDFYGSKELEFEVVSGFMYDEDGGRVDMGKNACAGVAEQYAEEIEADLWEHLRDEADCAAEDAAADRAEARKAYNDGWAA
jgi:hypothetical protein